MRSIAAIGLVLALAAAPMWAQSAGQPPVEACKPGDFTVIGYPNEVGPKAGGRFIVNIEKGFRNGFLTTEDVWIPSINSSIERWNGIGGANWTFENRGLTDNLADFEDGEVTIAPCGGLFPCPGPPPNRPPTPPVPNFHPVSPAFNTTVAVTLIVTDKTTGNGVADSDIFFNPTLPISTSPREDQIDFESVLGHELGHALGLGHNDNCVVGPTIMESLIDTGQIGRDLSASEHEGVRFLYPADTSPAVRIFERDRALRFDAVEGGLAPFPRVVSVFGPGGKRWVPTITAGDSKGAEWVHVTPDGGPFPGEGTMEISVGASSLAPGAYDATIDVNLEGHPGPPVSIAVELVVVGEDGPGGLLPFLTQAGLANGANLQSARLAGGSLFTIFGASMGTTVAQATSVPLATTLGGVQVLVNNKPAALLYASPTQINGQIPPGTTIGLGGIVVRNGFGDSAPLSMRIDPAAPELFLVGNGDALILNQNGTVNSASNPAPAGTTVSIFLTGQGAVAPPVGAGRPAAVNPLSQVIAISTAEIDGQDANLPFLGLAPGYVGLAQGNVEVPAGVTGRVSIRIRIGEIWSNVGFLHVN